MQNDLNQRSSEVAKKWEFDFSNEQPQMGKNMSWEPIKTTQQTRPRMQIPQKPKMDIKPLLAFNKNDGNSGNGSA